MSSVIPVQVDAVVRETDEIASYTLAPLTSGALPAFDCGAHIDVHLPNGITRQYSLLGPCDRLDRYRIAVKREAESRGGSRYIHEALNVGSKIAISPPRNNFPMVPEADRVVLLAAGVGITPILTMAEDLAGRGADYELHYFTRSPELTAFADHIAGSTLAENTYHHFGMTPEQVRQELVAILASYRPGAHVYLCGPGPFIDMVLAETAETWPKDAVHLEYFSNVPVAPRDDDDGFEVHLANSGQSYFIPPDMSIAEVLMEHGIDIEVSCEQGVCGTCVTKVLEGMPEHNDMFLSDEEHERNDQMTICVSRCMGNRLVLDI